MTQCLQVALVIYNLQLQLGDVLVVIPLVPGGRVGSELMSSDLGQGRAPISCPIKGSKTVGESSDRNNNKIR